MTDPSIDIRLNGSHWLNGQAIILAGGLGTRLRSAVPDLPKCMAQVAGRPFLFYVINYLRGQGISNFIFSLGYKHEVIEAYLAKEFSRLQYTCVVEDEPLGTGGAIHLACKQATYRTVVVTNGDTLFKIDLARLFYFHQQKKAGCTLALKPMENFDRYGAVELGEDGKVNSFKEKQFYEAGLINGGTYVLDRNAFLAQSWPEKFSFEKDYLEASVSSGTIYGERQTGYFIDIGIPVDFEKAQQDLMAAPLDLKMVDNKWTLFLDRDGVINEDKEGSYIFSTDEFRFMAEGPGFFKELTKRFRYIIVVTNQRGVGRGLMTEETLALINMKMQEGIAAAGGKLAAIYYAVQNDNLDPDRKPNPGMVLRAVQQFPDIDLSKSIMVGNNLSDMQFGRNAGIYTVFLRTTNKTVALPHPDIDMMFETLADFAKAL